MQNKKVDIVIIGAGPGGYVAAITAAKTGFKTAIVEFSKEEIGGTCLNRGCIPLKSLLHTVKTVENLKKQINKGAKVNGEIQIDFNAAIKRSQNIINNLRAGVELLLRKNGVELIFGKARLITPQKVEVEGKGIIECEKIIIATGAIPREIETAPFDGKLIIDTTDALKLTSAPEEMVIVGAGASGLEIGLVMSCCGSKVTIIEILDKILPFFEEDATKIIEKSCKKRGIQILTGASITKIEKLNGYANVLLTCNGKLQKIRADKILITAGVKPRIENLWEPQIPIEIENGYIKTDESMKTSVDSVYAIGDITGFPLLAHAASYEGVLAVENIAKKSALKKTNLKKAIPMVVYFSPQVAQIGLTEKDAQKNGIDVVTGRFHLKSCGMAVIKEETDGFIKLTCEKTSGKILGCTIVGSEAEELISQISIAIQADIRINNFINAIYPHPTISEIIKEAALDVSGMSIHKV